ncbi:hypothetical protein D3C79_584890 [compost metagenome]
MGDNFSAHQQRRQRRGQFSIEGTVKERSAGEQQRCLRLGLEQWDQLLDAALAKPGLPVGDHQTSGHALSLAHLGIETTA